MFALIAVSTDNTRDSFFHLKDIVLLVRRYENPNYKPETVWRPSQVYNGKPYGNKTVSS